MKSIYKVLADVKQIPLELFGSLLFFTTLFGLFYIALWVVCPS